MAHHNPSDGTMSESIEMYLLKIALLQSNDQPVPLPLLAQELAVSPVSANEMCKKLVERALVAYEPYKGVTLTEDGEALAARVIRCRRLWEVFFVERLGIAPLEAEAMACRFEHVTPTDLAERLAAFLGHPTLSPQQEPIPPGVEPAVEEASWPLTRLAPGEQGRVVNIRAEAVAQEFLRRQGVLPGVELEVVAVAADGSMLLAAAGRRLSLAGAVARSVQIATPAESVSSGSAEQTIQPPPTEVIHALKK